MCTTHVRGKGRVFVSDFMTLMEEYRTFLSSFHTRHPGGTAEALRRLFDQHGRSSYRALAEAVLDGSGASPRILEIGCGDGVLLEEMQTLRPHSELTGIDLTASDIELARARVPGARLIAGDFTTQPFGPSTFDIVTSHLVLMLAGPLEPVLKQVQRILCSGGTFGFVVDDVNTPSPLFVELIAVALDAAGVESATTPFRELVDRRLYDRDALSALFSKFDLQLTSFDAHVLHGEFAFTTLWEMLRRMYQIGSLSDELRERAHVAVRDRIGSESCEMQLNFELVLAKRR